MEKGNVRNVGRGGVGGKGKGGKKTEWDGKNGNRNRRKVKKKTFLKLVCISLHCIKIRKHTFTNTEKAKFCLSLCGLTTLEYLRKFANLHLRT
jgi:hypothetical protein